MGLQKKLYNSATTRRYILIKFHHEWNTDWTCLRVFYLFKFDLPKKYTEIDPNSINTTMQRFDFIIQLYKQILRVNDKADVWHF